MVLDAALLNTQNYKVRIKSKVEQSKEWSSALPYNVIAIEKGAFGSPSTEVANFVYLLRKHKKSINLLTENEKQINCISRASTIEFPFN